MLLAYFAMTITAKAQAFDWVGDYKVTATEVCGNGYPTQFLMTIGKFDTTKSTHMITTMFSQEIVSISKSGIALYYTGNSAEIDVTDKNLYNWELHL